MEEFVDRKKEQIQYHCAVSLRYFLCTYFLCTYFLCTVLFSTLPKKNMSTLMNYPLERNKDSLVIRQICDRVLYAYRNVYKITADEYAVLLKIHKWFLQNKERNVDISIVMQTFNKQNPQTISKMIDKYIIDRKRDDVLAEIIEIGRKNELKVIEDEYFKFE